MKTTILDELLKISADATSAVVMGVTMKVINPAQAQTMLDTDPEDKHIHECILANGRFLFICENGNLRSLYKVSGDPRLSNFHIEK